MLTYREAATAFIDLQIPSDSPVIVHASLSAFGDVRGGAETILGALSMISKEILMPAFTFKTMVIPKEGPPDNGMTYGSGEDINQMAEFFRHDLPVDPLIGSIPETFRQLSQTKRTSHPIFSFSATNLDYALRSQTLSDPFTPIAAISSMKGWVLLLGVDQTVNTSIHYAEKLAGRRQFIRWALTHSGIVECPGFPGCSDGFNAISPMLEDVTRKVNMNGSQVQAIPLNFLIHAVKTAIDADPFALLCDRQACERCNAIRNEHFQTEMIEK
jgi:aminoglycoside 3-N-acetyltransferase